jgi:cell division protein FtsB
MTTRVEMPSVPVRRRSGAPWVQRLMIFLTLLVAVDSLFGERGLTARARLDQEMSATADHLTALKNENAGLREQIRRLESDPAAIELLAREELGFIRPGELLVLFVR